MNHDEKPVDGAPEPPRPFVEWVASADGVLTDEMLAMLDRDDLGAFEKYMREQGRPFRVEFYRRP